jgi:hypothetical protein
VLRDLAFYPSLIHVEGTTEEPAFVVAARMPDERAQVWSTNLWRVASVWKLGQPAASGSGWQMALADSKATLGVHKAGDWTVFAAGFKAGAMGEKLAAKLAAAPASEYPAGGDLLRVEADWPRLKDWTPLLAPYPILPMTMRVSGEGDYIRTQADFHSEKPLDIQYEPWQVPSNFVSEPVVSFTAARGVRPLLAPLPLVEDIGVDPVPNQIFVWGQRLLNGQTMLAVPTDRAKEQMVKIHPTLPAAIADRLNNRISGNIYWLSNQFELVWRGLPVIIPFAKAVHTNDQSFVVAGLFPYMILTNPPPPELFQQLRTEKDILYYDWEITQDRLIHNRHYYQMLDIFARRRTVPTDSPMFVWLQDIHPKLGNAVTEARQTDARTIGMTRRAHLGLTGYELVTFMRWFHSGGFPLTFPRQPNLEIPEKVRELQEKASGRAAPPRTP